MGKKEKLGNKINKFKRILNFFKITSLLMTLVYFIYALVTERGNNVINIVLTVIYFIYMVFIDRMKFVGYNDRDGNPLKMQVYARISRIKEE